FRMLADIRDAAARAGVSDAVWADLVPRRRSMFGSTCLRLSREPDTRAFQELQTFAVRSGMNAVAVAGALAIAGAARRLGAGALLNGAIDGLLGWRGGPPRTAAADPARADARLSSPPGVPRASNGR